MTLALIAGLLATMAAVALLAPDDPGFARIEVELWAAEVEASVAVLSPAYTRRRLALAEVVERLARERRAEMRRVTRAALDGLSLAIERNEWRMAA